MALSSTLIKKIQDEHQEVYQRLDYFLHEVTKVKKQADNKFLCGAVQQLLAYVCEILDEHFKEEERDLFPLLEEFENVDRELFEKIKSDHLEIEDKYKSLFQALATLLVAHNVQNLEGDLPRAFVDEDLTQTLLYPSYNLIATINHHAQREDLLFQSFGLPRG